MTIKSKLIVTFCFLLVILMITGGIGIYSIQRVNQNSIDTSTVVIPILEIVNDLNYNIARFRSHEYEHMSTVDLEAKTVLEERMVQLNENVLNYIDAYLALKNDERLAQLKDNWIIYTKEDQKLIEASRNNNIQEAYKIIKEDSKASYEVISEITTTLKEESTELAESSSEKGNDLYELTRNILLIVIAISTVIGIFVGVQIIRSIRKPLSQLEVKLNELVKHGGDLTKKIEINSKDEIGRLAKAVNKFIENIRNIIVEVNENLDQVEISSNIIAEELKELAINVDVSAEIIEDLSAGMEETAASAQEMNASSEEIQKAASEMASRSEQGAASAGEINQKASKLKQVALQSEKNASEVYQNTKNSLEKALHKSEAIKKIDVLSTSILSISNQTNLLSLNAAIEAARAGEAGKGFAVVAGEIRNLAEHSKNTVTEIQDVTQEVMHAVDELTFSARSIMDFFDETVMLDYNHMVQTGETYGNDGEFMDHLVTDFSATAEELSATIDGIIRAIQEVSQTVNQGAEGTQNMSQKMSQIVQLLEHVKDQTNASLTNTQKLRMAIGKFTV